MRPAERIRSVRQPVETPMDALQQLLVQIVLARPLIKTIGVERLELPEQTTSARQLIRTIVVELHLLAELTVSERQHARIVDSKLAETTFR